MTFPPRRADAQRNRERLLSAAEAVLDDRGVHASLDDIAKAAGVGNATLYRHFSSREKLLEAVYDRRIRALCDSAEKLRATRPRGAALVAWLREMVVHLTESRALSETFMADYKGPGDTETPQIAGWHRAIYEAVAPLHDAAQETGAIRRDLDVPELLTLTTAVARAADPARALHFLDVLLEGAVPRADNTSDK
ncbi:TetR/AcrR family transcriptional regulator [Nocardia blacklockiae]|uniref:TetR/AcrR family transcriptional regulator n=1 Tax=Nocardia blacklockiae TaxID=480036 RepID=UPI0018951EC8|nr:TetR/AcrR family transcriptional regulator [Nocardia blacklockiae]MBF6171961.1 TetR/AcrR family transcriptional regulator [Nocardia blacklockiae]